MAKPTILAFSGWSGSGKTTLVCAVVEALTRQDLRVGVIKHDGHAFSRDVCGSDTHRLTEAGATRTVLCGRSGLVVREAPCPEPELDVLISRFGAGVDVLLLEGFKHAAVDKIEVYRPSVGQPPLFGRPQAYPRIIAVATDEVIPLPAGLVHLDLNRPDEVAAFILRYRSQTDRGRAWA